MAASLTMPASNPIGFWSSRPSTINSITCGRLSIGFQVFARYPMTNNEDELMPLAPINIIKQWPYWRLALSNIMTLSIAAERMWTNLSWNIGQLDMTSDTFGSGKLINGGSIFQQNYLIRSYEIGANGVASLEALLNFFQV